MAKVFPAQAIDRLEVTIGSKKLGELFLDLGYITCDDLAHALEYQHKKGGQLGWVLASLGYVTRLELYEGLAKHLSLSFEMDMVKVLLEMDRKLAQAMTHEEMVQYQTVPVSADGRVITILTAKPNSQNVTDFIKKRFRISHIIPVVATDVDVMKLSAEIYRNLIPGISPGGPVQHAPEETARVVFTKEQIAFTAGFLGMFGLLLYLETPAAVLAMLCVAQVVFASLIAFRLALAVWGKLKGPPLTMQEADKPFNDRDLPVYTVLVPAYREKAVIGGLIKCIRKFDYPEDRLDIILLLEEDDTEMLERVKAEKLPANWRFLVCPESDLKTKTSALNYGLAFAKGEFLAVYDAESLPEPGQLRKAVSAFRTHTRDYLCFKASPDYFNRKENLLTISSSLEQYAWNDCVQTGLLRMGLPVPLGGAGSHFDVKKLKNIGGWDSYNVSADADLGMRAAAAGYKTGLIDSITWEEAAPKFKQWLKQLSRQAKGRLQTFFVHSRRPSRLIKNAGFFPWLGYMALTGGMPLVNLLNPVMWLLLGFSVLADITGFFYVPSAIIYITAFNIIAGNFVLTYIAILGAKNSRLIIPAFLTPVYWMMQSLAAYKGLWQLFTKPHYWEKAQHGLTKAIPISRTLEVPENVPEMIVIKEPQR